MQDINEKSVVLEEVVSLQAAAVSDPKVRKKFAIVGCGEREVESWQSYIYQQVLVYGTASSFLTFTKFTNESLKQGDLTQTSLLSALVEKVAKAVLMDDKIFIASCTLELDKCKLQLQV